MSQRPRRCSLTGGVKKGGDSTQSAVDGEVVSLGGFFVLICYNSDDGKKIKVLWRKNGVWRGSLRALGGRLVVHHRFLTPRLLERRFSLASLALLSGHRSRSYG